MSVYLYNCYLVSLVVSIFLVVFLSTICMTMLFCFLLVLHVHAIYIMHVCSFYVHGLVLYRFIVYFV
jgi:hypothetical protein